MCLARAGCAVASWCAQVAISRLCSTPRESRPCCLRSRTSSKRWPSTPYRQCRTGSRDDADRHTALLLATHAALTLAHARNTELAAPHETELRHAIGTRDVIGQARGIVMHRQGITAEQAFSLLRSTSQDLNVTLVERVRKLVAHHGELDE